MIKSCENCMYYDTDRDDQPCFGCIEGINYKSIEDKRTMNNFENLKAMNIDELAEWLDENGIWDNSPWSKHFDSKYCQKCESVIGTVCDDFGDGRKCEFAWCEFEHKCRYFPDMDDVPDCKDIIKMWLESNEEDI